MSEPTRYTQNIKCVEPSYLAQNIQSGMVECSIGEWVLHSDYARLKAEVERLRKAGDAMAEAMWYGDAERSIWVKKFAETAWNAAKEGKQP